MIVYNTELLDVMACEVSNWYSRSLRF